MLTELLHVKQVEGEKPRRWFEGDGMDLIVWEHGADEIAGFQLCYGKGENERVLTWRKDGGYVHDAIDGGESYPFLYKRAPILVPDGQFDAIKVAERFLDESANIDRHIATFVYARLREYAPDQNDE